MELKNQNFYETYFKKKISWAESISSFFRFLSMRSLDGHLLCPYVGVDYREPHKGFGVQKTEQCDVGKVTFSETQHPYLLNSYIPCRLLWGVEVRPLQSLAHKRGQNNASFSSTPIFLFFVSPSSLLCPERVYKVLLEHGIYQVSSL